MNLDEGREERLRTVQDVVKQTKKYARTLQTQDILSIATISTVLPIGFLIQIAYVFTFWFELFSDHWFIRVGMLTLIGMNFYANVFEMIRVGPNGPAGSLPTVVQQGFRYCHSCQLNSPPRAYHCPVCDTCVLRRDHHCSFGAICVGHFNQRYFVAGVANLWLATAICTYYSFHFIIHVIPQMGSTYQIWQVMIPHLALFLGHITPYQFMSIFYFVSVLTVWLFTTYLVAAQAFCIYRGQTRMEYLLDIHAYNLGVWENIRQALGEHWILALISPFLPSRLPSNGTSFHTFNADDIQKTTKYL